VTGITMSDGGIRFHVDKIGTPVEVKVSYFPNWQAIGAEGPWRVAPDLMVVVPTGHDVVLRYGRTPADEAGWLITVVSILTVGALGIAGRTRQRRRHRRHGSAEALSGAPDA
jgi:uncharacterized membrane protein